MRAIVVFLFLLPQFLCAMDVQTEAQVISVPLRGSLSKGVDDISCSARAASAERSGVCNALISNIAVPGDGTQAPRNSQMHKRTESAPLPVNSNTPKISAPKTGINAIAQLNLAGVSQGTPSSSCASTAKSKNENEGMAMLPGVPQPTAGNIVSDYLNPEAINFKICFDYLHMVMKMHTEPRSILAANHQHLNDKKEYFRPILLKTAQELYHDKIGPYKMILRKTVEAILESYYPSNNHNLAHSVSSSVSIPNQTDKKERAEPTSLPKPKECCIIS